jgi:hypothetical protein
MHPAHPAPAVDVPNPLGTISSDNDLDVPVLVTDLRRLVDALVDQLAAGQVETLYSLQTVTTAVRRSTTQLQAAAVAPVEQLTQILSTLDACLAALSTTAERVADDVRQHVQEQIGQQLSEFRESLVQTTQSAVDDVRATNDQALTRFHDVTQQAVTDLEAQTETMHGARDSLVTAAQSAVDDVRATSQEAVTGLYTATQDSVGRVEATNEQALARFHEVTQQAVADLEARTETLLAVSSETLTGIEYAGTILVNAFTARIEGFFATLDQTMLVQNQRDNKLEKTLEGRIDRLVSRSETTIAQLTERLRDETDRLAQRDVEQEQARASAFVSVLEGLLARVGGRSKLRDRVRDVIAGERTSAPEGAATPTPTPTPAADPGPQVTSQAAPPAPRKAKPEPQPTVAAAKAAPRKAAAKADDAAPQAVDSPPTKATPRKRTPKQEESQ